jgi:hypothetical protein
VRLTALSCRPAAYIYAPHTACAATDAQAAQRSIESSGCSGCTGCEVPWPRYPGRLVHAGTLDGEPVRVESARFSCDGGEAGRVRAAAALAAKTALRHPNLVATYSIRMANLAEPGSVLRAVAVQEHCAGDTLKGTAAHVPAPVLLQQPFPALLRLLRSVAAGMAHAHACGVTHGCLSWDMVHLAVRARLQAGVELSRPITSWCAVAVVAHS